MQKVQPLPMQHSSVSTLKFQFGIVLKNLQKGLNFQNQKRKYYNYDWHPIWTAIKSHIFNKKTKQMFQTARLVWNLII